MKILHVSKKYPNALGGDAVVVSNLQQQQQAAGHEVMVVTSNCDEIINSPTVHKFGLKDSAAKLDEISFKRLVSLTLLLVKMFGIVRKERPDVIHTHSVDMAFAVSFAARAYSVPVIHTFHIVTFYDQTQPILRRKTELWLAKRAKLGFATAPNAYDVKKLQAAGIKQAVLLPNGVNIDFWAASRRTKASPIFTFLSVGRLENQKGYNYLLEAIAQLVKVQAAPFRVIIIGEGSEADSLRRLAHELKVEDKVAFVGRKQPDEVRTLLAQADAAVFPSLYETTPITMLEAWAAAVPTIVTEVGILRDPSVDHEAAFIVPPKDAQKLMFTMNRCMLDNFSRELVAAKGHSEVKKYTWPVIASSAEALYRSAV